MNMPKTMLLTVAALYSFAAAGSAYGKGLGGKVIFPV
jgi:hypothetical protein